MQGAEDVGRVIESEVPVACADFSHAQLTRGVVRRERASETGARDIVRTRDERARGQRAEILDNRRCGRAGDRANLHIRRTAHVENGAGRQNDIGVGVISARAQDDRAGIDVDRRDAGAGAAELQSTQACLDERSPAGDIRVEGEADLFVEVAARPEHARSCHLVHGDGGAARKCDVTGEGRHGARIIEAGGVDVAAADGQHAGTGLGARAAVTVATLAVEGQASNGVVEAVEVEQGTAAHCDGRGISDLVVCVEGHAGVGDRAGGRTSGATSDDEITGDGVGGGRGAVDTQVQNHPIHVGVAHIGVRIVQRDEGARRCAHGAHDEIKGAGDVRVDGQAGARAAVQEQFRAGRSELATGGGVGGGAENAGSGIRAADETAAGERQGVRSRGREGDGDRGPI